MNCDPPLLRRSGIENWLEVQDYTLGVYFLYILQ